MIHYIPVEEFILKAAEHPVIDVRSPREFRQGHIPGAFNIPLFDDEERAIVGTLYKLSGREASVLKGLEVAGPKMAGFVKEVHRITKGKIILMHCWRGGMRSANMAWLFEQAGYHINVLEGGYKSYRRFIRSAFNKRLVMIVLGGMTGSGKSEVLQRLLQKGEQILDLEEIASHKGSVFGALGQNTQPTNEQFENNLFVSWQNLNPLLPVWIEDESRTIGNVNIPDPLYEQMSHAEMIRIEIPREQRIRRLIREYSIFPKEELIAAIKKIREKIGGDRANDVIKAIDSTDFYPAVDLILDYYDKTYRFAAVRKYNLNYADLLFEEYDPEIIATRLLSIKEEIIEKYEEKT